MIREETGDKRLVGYVVTNEDKPLRTGEIRTFLKESLPDYMVPSTFVELESLPLTPNAKIDRQALPIPEQTRPELESSYVAPRNPDEEKLVKIWSNIFNLEQIGVHDDFFELGGHSLIATQVISRVRDAFQIELPLRSLFENPTVAGLGESIETIRWLARSQQTVQSAAMINREEGEL